jgi:hypothetical protein
VQSSRRLEREAARNVEVMWLLGHHNTIADFCKDNGGAIKKVCARFVGAVPADWPAIKSKRCSGALGQPSHLNLNAILSRGKD